DDMLRVDGTIVRVTGIEEPEPYQTCTDGDGHEWSCGRGACQGLRALLRTGRVVCDASGSAEGHSTGDCKVGDVDVAAELVRGGHVFATSGLFASYAGIENEARGNKAGIWAGQATRPSDYRAQKWEE